MDELKRPTSTVVHLIDIDEESPNQGETVLGLTVGGVLIKLVWTKDSHKTIKAWMPHPKVPQSVKNKLGAMYASGRSWGIHGTQVHSDD